MPPRDVRELLGRVVTLPIRRFGSPGAFLAVDPDDAHPSAAMLLLPGAEIPQGAAEGDALEVFVYLDSEDRPVATVRDPVLVLGEVTFLRVTDVTSFGAFVDWGLPKDLLVPLAEQTRDLHLGDRHAIGLYVDDSGRLAGTMRVSELLRTPAPPTTGAERRSIGEAKAPEASFAKTQRRSFEVDEWVDGESWRQEEQGVFVIVERRFVALLPATEPHRLSRGEAARFRITHIHRDGKLELSLRAPAHEELDRDARAVLTALLAAPDLRVGDRSTPEELRARFGLSKKAFKRAVGRLLKQKAIALDADGVVVVIGTPTDG